MTMLAMTSIGVYLTVPETQHVIPMMAIAVIAAAIFLATSSAPPPPAIVLVAGGILATGLHDATGNRAAMVRVVGCFGVLLVAPIARRVTEGRHELWEPRSSSLLVVHGFVVAVSSRALVHSHSTKSVALLVTATLVATVAVLVLA